MQAVPGFRLQSELHQSRHSVVMRATREADGSPVIIKLHRNEFPTVSEIARYEQEFSAARQLRLCHSVRLLDMIRVGHRFALVYEDDGCISLKRLVAGRPLALKEWLEIAGRIAEALVELDANGLVHGECSPDNILLHPERGDIKLTDFELINQVTDPAACLSLASLTYIAPEQTGRVKATPDHRSDLYALGATLFELATGRPPFSGLDDAALIHAHLAVLPPSLGGFRPDWPPVIDALVQRLLAKAPADRYQTAAGVAADLAQLLHLLNTGKPLELALGRKDFRAGLNMPDRLYGRSAAMTTMARRFIAARDEGSFQWVVLKGPAGIGKSSLLNELESLVNTAMVCRGACTAGSVKPYAPLIDAFDALIRRWLSLPEAQLAPIQSALKDTLGASASALISLLPSLGRLLGPLPEAQPPNANSAQAQLELAGQNFLRFVMQQQAPLVLVVDDLHWADVATLGLLQSLIVDGIGPCLLVTTERDEQSDLLDAWHHSLAAQEVRPDHIDLGLLSERELADLVDDALSLPSERRDALVAVLHDKTLGNPFFVHQLLAQWTEHGYLHRDAGGHWQVSLDCIAEQSVADNVLDLLIARVRSLPEDWRELLGAAACLGMRFKADDLAGLERFGDVSSVLGRLSDHGFFRPEPADGDMEYAFIHDRVREAVLAELDQTQATRWHLAIARRLASRPETNAFAVVAHYNQALDCLTDPAEQEAVARFNAEAAGLARAQTAFTAALEFARIATEQWPAEASERDPASGLRMELLLADSLASCGHLQDATGVFERALQQSDTPTDQAAIIERMADAMQSSGKPAQALIEIERAMVLLGVDLQLAEPEDINVRQQVLFQQLTQAELLERIDQLPEASEEAARISRLYDKTIIAVYFSQPSLLAYVTGRAVEHVLATGLTPEAGLIFGWWSMVLCMQHQYREAEAYARLPKLLHQRFGNDYYGGAGRMAAAAMALGWTRPYGEVFEESGVAAELSHQSGNLQFASYALLVQHITTVIEASNLEAMRKSGERWFDYCRRHVPLELGQARIRDYSLKRLMGRTETPLDCEAIIADYEAQNNQTDACESLVEMARAAWITEDFSAALAYSERAEPAFKSGAAGSLLLNYGHAVIYSIALARKAAQTEGADGLAWQEKAEAIAGRVFRVTALSPENFFAYDRLVTAELHAMRGEREQAMAACLSAINHAQQQQQTLLQAQALRTLIHLMAAGSPGLIEALAREASQLFQRAGCVVMTESGQGGRARSGPGAVADAGHGRHLQNADLASILKANEAIAAEINYDRLLSRLLDVAMENVGAERAVVVMNHQTPRLIASSHEESLNEPLEGTRCCPEQMVTYVLRSGLPVILDDGSRRSIYRDDNYFVDHAVLSVMAVPILRKGQVLGAVYLENNLVAGAFDDQRLQMIQHLMGMAAIALENAELYQQQQRYAQRLEARVRRRTQALERANATLTRLAELDGLTQISNRRVFDRQALQWIEEGRNLSLVLCDVDDFKAYNDHYGHLAGDEVLRRVARTLSALELDGQGLVARYGGEEFAVLLHDLPRARVLKIAQLCRERVLALDLPHVAARAMPRISLSVGVAFEGRSLDGLFERADRALYAAKSGGRNQVVLDQPVDTGPDPDPDPQE